MDKTRMEMGMMGIFSGKADQNEMGYLRFK
jgi:hypothetical protein